MFFDVFKSPAQTVPVDPLLDNTRDAAFGQVVTWRQRGIGADKSLTAHIGVVISVGSDHIHNLVDITDDTTQRVSSPFGVTIGFFEKTPDFYDAPHTIRLAALAMNGNQEPSQKLLEDVEAVLDSVNVRPIS